MSVDLYERVRETPTFRYNRFAAWAAARLLVVGCGMLGSRFILEAVRSGLGAVSVVDFEQVEPHNVATQLVRAGYAKVDSIVGDCDAIRPGVAQGKCADIRHVGIGELRRFDAIVDMSDDPALTFPLTEIANGLGIPLLRAAVDGSGRFELGRVLCSDPRDGGACQLCTHSWESLSAGRNRTPCPGAVAHRPPTRAGNALASAISGIALLQSQRLVTGNDLELVRDREVIADLSHWHIMAAVLRQSASCISGHQTWDLIDVSAGEITVLDDLYAAAARLVGHEDFSLEAYAHPFCLEAACACGHVCPAVGSQWAASPICARCEIPMSWRTAIQVAALTRHQAESLGILDRSLRQLGLPDSGAMFVIRQSGRPVVRFVITSEELHTS